MKKVMNNEEQQKLVLDYRHVEILDKESVYKGFFTIYKYTVRFCKFDGDWSEVVTREVFERGESACVLLYDPNLNKVVLIEQFRIGAVDQIKKQGTPWLIEIVAGVIESNHSAEETVMKEAKEEAGFIINKFVKIAEYYVSPGGTTEKTHLFCAKIDAKNAKGIFGVAAEHENIRIVVVNCREAFTAVKIGKINNAATIIALQWLEINQKHLKKQWNS